MRSNGLTWLVNLWGIALKRLKENLEKLEEEATRLKTLVKKTGGAAWLQHSPLNWKIC